VVAENPNTTLNKISEIYDRIAFAGAGKYGEFERLRKEGIRYADLKGYAYGREDVTAKSLANAYAQVIGSVFSQEIKPLEVEILVLEVGEGSATNAMYQIAFDGSIVDERGYAAIGGQAEELKLFLRDKYAEGLPLDRTLQLAVRSLEAAASQKVRPASLEVALLERARSGRVFRRIPAAELRGLMGADGQEEPAPLQP